MKSTTAFDPSPLSTDTWVVRPPAEQRVLEWLQSLTLPVEHRSVDASAHLQVWGLPGGAVVHQDGSLPDLAPGLRIIGVDALRQAVGGLSLGPPRFWPVIQRGPHSPSPSLSPAASARLFAAHTDATSLVWTIRRTTGAGRRGAPTSLDEPAADFMGDLGFSIAAAGSLTSCSTGADEVAAAAQRQGVDLMPDVEVSTAFRGLAPALAASVLDACGSGDRWTAAAVRAQVDSHLGAGGAAHTRGVEAWVPPALCAVGALNAAVPRCADADLTFDDERGLHRLVDITRALAVVDPDLETVRVGNRTFASADELMTTFRLDEVLDYQFHEPEEEDVDS